MDTIGWQKILVRLLFAFILGSAVGKNNQFSSRSEQVDHEN